MYNPPLDGLDGPNVLALYEEGLPMTVIAEVTGRPWASIWYWLTANGHHLPSPHVDVRRVLDWYERGVPVKVISARLGISINQIHYHARKAGLRRAKLPVSDEERARMVALYRGGRNLMEIGRTTGRSVSSVRKMLQRSGVYDAARSAATLPSRPEYHPWKGS